ncbi:mitochondrial 37S ribosomal protein bS21m Ecym_7132 [Eremothecium cymbalariae DBVPG|uniref:Ribosomal protein S21 n=1 Tax=Eremothecium cymbalariae (strain CBS 270.75 / DBVPG 7215 / KCTC 17166 / NRRL Y-17582) TaxID=931890 RepID=G8JVW7_ERECY|nr:hypothetical protein Ecym_7132 [Eremothecium cymbalariae DBVPG\
MKFVAHNALWYRSFSACVRATEKHPVFNSKLLNPIHDRISSDTNNISKPNESILNQSFRPNNIFDINTMLSPREDALSSKLTGIQAGRSVSVFNGNTMQALGRLNAVVKSNQIPRDKANQRFYLKPGKAREIRRSQKHRKDFMQGFKRLIEVVKDAKRKGY